MNNDLANEILKSISLRGSASQEAAEIKPIIANSDIATLHLIDRSRGLLKLRRNVNFNLVISQPETLSALNPFEIRCCLCHRVISYPAFYYTKQYNINTLHFFICFSPSDPSKPTTACMRLK